MRVSRPSLSPTKILVSLSLCVGSTVTLSTPAAAACQAGTPGCVLPITEAPPPAPPPVGAGPVVSDGGGWGIWPFIIGLAALAALIYFLTKGDDDEAPPISP